MKTESKVKATKEVKRGRGRPQQIKWSEFNLQMANPKIRDKDIAERIFAKYQGQLKGGVSEDVSVIKKQKASLQVSVNIKRRANPKFASAVQLKKMNKKVEGSKTENTSEMEETTAE